MRTGMLLDLEEKAAKRDPDIHPGDASHVAYGHLTDVVLLLMNVGLQA